MKSTAVFFIRITTSLLHTTLFELLSRTLLYLLPFTAVLPVKVDRQMPTKAFFE